MPAIQEINAVEFSTFKFALTKIIIKIINKYDKAPYLVLMISILSLNNLFVFWILNETTLKMFGITAYIYDVSIIQSKTVKYSSFGNSESITKL